MYSPCLVLPYHWSFWQWYTLLDMLTQTLPAPPPGAAMAEGCGGVRDEDAAVVVFAGAGAAAGGAAGAAVVAGALDSGSVFLVLDFEVFSDLSLSDFLSVTNQLLTPPWPAHAPRLLSAVV